MTNKQTIDGVSRETIQRIADHCKFWIDHPYLEAIADVEVELRALLDAPAGPTKQEALALQVEKGLGIERLPAAQPQGEVERLRRQFDAYYESASATERCLNAQLAKQDALLREVTDKCNIGFAMRERLLAALSTSAEPKPRGEAVAFQDRVRPWMLECFGAEISCDQQERNHRFLEEALELVQSLGATASEAHQLVDYVYGRPVGAPKQEVGGVMVTLAALCLAGGLDMHEAGEVELSRIWTRVEQIRAKQDAKPAMSPLPGVYVEREQPAPSHSGDANEMVAKVVLPERDNMRDLIAEVIGGDAYDCVRVWSAWGVGTMSEDDFVPIADQDERLYEIADSVISEVAKLNGIKP